jgi:DNA-binding LacI/PurR family transcriptional regulator
VAEGDWTPQGGATATRLLLERISGLTAIFVRSDVMAIGVLSALWQAGRRVPADVAVVSCDDIPFAEFLTPPLTTVRVPLAATPVVHRHRGGDDQQVAGGTHPNTATPNIGVGDGH